MDDVFEFDVTQQRFFIAVSAYGTHSFLMLGAYSGFKVERLLCRVGKAFQSRGSSFWNELWSLFQAIFSSAPAGLYDEGTRKQVQGNQVIGYVAFDITYAQYLEFLSILDSLGIESNVFHCYKPVENEETPGFLKLTSKVYAKKATHSETIRQGLGQLSITNTCRHSAIQLAEAVLHHPLETPVSLCFMSGLPNKTQLKFGIPSPDLPFYVLPQPPMAYGKTSGLEHRVLNLLYHRMSEMLYLNPLAESTRVKFRLLKEYYEGLAGERRAMSAADLLLSIKLWRLDHQLHLSELRQRYFWDFFVSRSSKTNTVLDAIERELSQQLA